MYHFSLEEWEYAPVPNFFLAETTSFVRPSQLLCDFQLV